MKASVKFAAIAAAVVLFPFTQAAANQAFTDQAIAADGTFEWDIFNGSYAGPHAPEVAGSDSGATLSGGFFPPPPPPKFPASQIVDGMLYTGGYSGRFTVNLTGAEATGDFTTIVLQLAIAFPTATIPGEEPRVIVPDSIRLDGAAMTEFVDRGIGGDGQQYYWAQWQVAAKSDYTIGFDSNLNHFALGGAQLDYYNGDMPFDAVAAAPIPEPAAATLAALAIGGLALGARRRNAKLGVARV